MSRLGVSRCLAFCSKDRNKTSYRFCRRSMVTLCKAKRQNRLDRVGYTVETESRSQSEGSRAPELFPGVSFIVSKERKG